MKRLLTFLIFLPGFTLGQIYWVFFSDKDGMEPVTRSPEALLREERVSSLEIGWYDLRVRGDYINQVLEKGARLRHISRWLNAVSVEADMEALTAIRKLPFVTGVRPVLRFKRKFRPIPEISRQRIVPDYKAQIQMVSLDRLHQKGYHGEGVLITILDSGFRKSHSAFQRILREGRLIAERDFVWGDGNVADEIPEDTTSEGLQSEHGTAVWSVIGGYLPGELIGGAYGARFALAKTEKLGSETMVEMDNWVAAVEWADSLGAEVISSSLAYREFDDTLYTYEELDGSSTPVAQITNVAFEKGICVINSVGNDGPGTGSLWTPADSWGVLAVGAVLADSSVAYFSSRGPTADGRIKPDLCALGVSVTIANAASDYTLSTGNGTSFAAPIVAAGVAVLRQIHPDWSSQYIYYRVKSTASNARQPDNNLGWGIPDFYQAAILKDYSNDFTLLAFPNPALNQLKLYLKLENPTPYSRGKMKIFNIKGQLLFQRNFGLKFYRRNYILSLDDFFQKRSIASGLYLLVVQIGDQWKLTRFTVLR